MVVENRCLSVRPRERQTHQNGESVHHAVMRPSSARVPATRDIDQLQRVTRRGYWSRDAPDRPRRGLDARYAASGVAGRIGARGATQLRLILASCRRSRTVVKPTGQLRRSG